MFWELLSNCPYTSAGIIERGYRKLTFAHVRQAQCCVRCTFEGSFSVFLYQKWNLIRIKTSLNTYLIRIQTCTPCHGTPSYKIRSEKSQNKSSPNFSDFCPGFCPEFLSEFSPKFLRFFVLRFVGNGDQKKFTKNLRHFQCKIPWPIRTKNSQNVSGEEAK